MKLFLSLSFALLTANAQTGLPPLIDRELLFGNPEIAGAQLSPDGKYMSFLKPWKGTLNVWVKGIAQPFTAARLLTAETKRPIMSYFWTRDSKFIIFSKDNDGDENFNIYRVNPAPTPTAAAAPPAKDLTGIKGARVLIYNLPKSDPDVAYIGINDRDKAYHDLYKLKLSTGEKTLVRKNTEQASAWVFDLQGNLRLATRTAPNGDQETLRVDAASLTPIYSCSMLETCAPARFHKDGKQVYFETNKGDRNLTELTLLDITTGATTKVESDPLNRVDFGNASFNEADELIATAYDDDKLRRYFHSKAFEADYDWLETKLPGLQLSTVSRTRDENLWLVAASGDVEPGATYLYNRRAKTLTQQYKVRRTAGDPLPKLRWP
jgi:dipeptidyl aminopeptidase/acylaminoacyl peptidase